MCYIDKCCIEWISTFSFSRETTNTRSFRLDCVFMSLAFVQLYIICILSICILTCWTRYFIYRSREEQIAKSLSQTDAHSHPLHDPCVWCSVSTRWSQNNQVKFDTRDYFQRYLTNLYPKWSYFVIIERCKWSLWGSIFEFQAPNPRLVPNVTLLWKSFFNTLQNIPHIFFKDTNQLIYVLEHHQYATKHNDVIMSGGNHS